MKLVFDEEAFLDAIKASRGKVSLRKSVAGTGISHSTLCRIEKGKDFTIENFTKICNWLGKEPGAFFKEV